MPKGVSDKRYNLVCKYCEQSFISKQPWAKFCCTVHKQRYNWPQVKNRYKTVDHKFKRLYQSCKSRDPDCTISSDYLKELFTLQKGCCALTGSNLLFVHGTGYGLNKETLFNTSVDRIDQSKGYEIGNVRLVCYQANMMRSILTDTELVEWCSRIVENLSNK